MNYQNIFITGSTGVVGKPLLKKIVENGHNVYALSRSNLHNEFFKNLNIKKIEGDILSDSLQEKLSDKNINAIFHVAGVNQMCSKNPDHMFNANIKGTKIFVSKFPAHQL